jgi:PAS domain S-box-containing protein
MINSQNLRLRIVIALLLLFCSGVAGAHSDNATHPVILPVTDASDIRFIHVSFGSFKKEPAFNRVHAIAQDSKGFLWFATQDKLQRYDGYEIREYPNDPNGPTAVYEEESLLIDRRGILWGGWERGLDEFDPTTEIFKRFSPTDGPFKARVISAIEDRQGALWFATNDGLIRMDPSTGRTIRYGHSLGDPKSLSSDRIRSAFESKDGTFWVATTSGVDLFDRRTAKVRQHIVLPPDLPGIDPNPELQLSFCEDHAGVLWMTFSYGYGLARINRESGTLTVYSLDGTGKDNTLQAGARSIVELGDGTLWIGTTASGILKLNPERTRFVRYRNNPADPNSLSGDQVHALFLDREGNMWAGTNGAGVNRFSPRPLAFKAYQHKVGDPNSLDMNYTTSIFEDSRGLLWIGSMKALGQLDRKTGKMIFYRRSGGPGELSSTWVVSMAEDRSGHLWFGTVGAGVNRFDRRTGKFKVFRYNPADPHSLSHNTVQAVFVDHKGTVWVGTEDGLDRFDEATQSFQVYKAGHGRNESRVDQIAEDLKGALWIATQATGLVRFDPDSGHFTSYRHTSDSRSLSNDMTNSVCVDHTGMIWVGTQNGLNRLDPGAGTFTRYYERNGLAGNNVSKILEDETGSLWVSTSKGLSRLDPRNNVFKNYYISDGLAGNEFYNYATAFKSPTGEMFFSSYAGVTSFFPRNVTDNPYPPPVVINDLRVSGKSLAVGDKSPLNKSAFFARSIRLSHKQNVVSVQFSALSYRNPDGNRYRYRLSGLETAWNESGSDERVITYSLSSGDYVFHVQGANSSGIWNQQGTSLEIVILPPWWGTAWFRALGAAMFLALLWAAYQFRVHQLQRVSEQLREVIDTIPGYVWSALPDGSLDFINRRWLEFSGVSLEEGLGWGWQAAIHPDDVARFVDEWRTAVACGKAMETEARVRRADGQYRWLLIRNVPLRDKGGKIVKWYGTSADIDDRKRAEEALRQSEAYLAEAQTLNHTGSWAFDVASNRYVHASEECLRIFGLDPQEALPTREVVFRRIHPDDSERVNRSFEKPVREKAENSDEFRIVLPDGTVKHVYVIRHPVLNSAGDVVKLFGTAVDITERKRAEEERHRLRQLEADLAHINRVSMLGELAASIAHEVNQPLSGIVTNGSACLRFLDRDTPDMEEVREAVHDIVRDGKRAGEVIARIRALTRKTAPPREKLNLNETFREVVSLVGDEAKRKGVMIRTRFADGLSPVSGDRVQLQQVVLNLIMNGIEAMSGVGERARELVITTRNIDADQLQVTVEDSGIGLDPNTMPRIFEPFYTTKPAGMGMGLSISRSILQNHGGRLWATANDGPGTSFHFTLPKYHAGASNAGAAGV